MISFPTCKINLGLNILAKRKDGYHEINSLMYPVPVKDVLEIVPAENFEFTNSGLKIPGELKDNLIFKRSEEHTSELQSRPHLVCRLLLEKKKNKIKYTCKKKTIK